MENIISEKERTFKKLGRYNLLLNIIILFIIISNIIGIGIVIVNPAADYNVNGEIIRATLSNNMRIKSFIASWVCLLLSIYPLISLKNIIKQLRNYKGETFTSDNIKMLYRSGLCIGIFAFLKIFNLVSNSAIFNMNKTETILLHDVGVLIPKLSISKIGITLDFETMCLLTIVVFIIVLVEIIKVGKILKEENELTI